jgi:predicted Zn-dependent protease
MSGVRLMVLSVLLAAVGLLMSGCGGETFLISKNEEINIGQQAAAEFEQEHRIERNTQRSRLVDQIGARIAAAAQPPDYPYKFSVVAEDVNNAFALPGGPVYIYAGLMDELGNNPDRIAWVLGHEATHISHQHAIKRIESAMGAQLLLEIALGGGTAGDIGGVVASLALQNYSRENEYESDRVGARYAAGAGYDPTAGLLVLQKFRELQGSDPSDLEIMFHSHPGNTDRENSLKRYLDANRLYGQNYRGG